MNSKANRLLKRLYAIYRKEKRREMKSLDIPQHEWLDLSDDPDFIIKVEKYLKEAQDENRN